jgi:hypothetical protein
MLLDDIDLLRERNDIKFLGMKKRQDGTENRFEKRLGPPIRSKIRKKGTREKTPENAFLIRFTLHSWVNHLVRVNLPCRYPTP